MFDLRAESEELKTVGEKYGYDNLRVNIFQIGNTNRSRMVFYWTEDKMTVFKVERYGISLEDSKIAIYQVKMSIRNVIANICTTGEIL